MNFTMLFKKLQKLHLSDVQLSERLAPVGPIEGIPETLRTIIAHIVLSSFRGTLNWSPIMPRNAILFDSEDVIFLRSRLMLNGNNYM